MTNVITAKHKYDKMSWGGCDYEKQSKAFTKKQRVHINCRANENRN